MKITSVDIETPHDRSPSGAANGSMKVAIILQGLYSILGLVVGVIFLIGGLLLLLSGIGGSSHFVAQILGAKFDVTDATVGVICAVLGCIVIFVTRFEVRIQNKK